MSPSESTPEHPLPFFRSLPHSPVNVDAIKSNMKREDKELLGNVLAHFLVGEGGETYGDTVGRRIRLEEVWVRGGGGEGEGEEAESVCEIVVTRDMTNVYGTLHSVCAAYLLDVCSSIPLLAMGISKGLDYMSVSQNLNLVWHGSVGVGETLKVVGRSVSVGGRVMTCRCEMYEKRTGRILASALHTKVRPGSKGRPWAKL
ncbi:hypothetical protein JAAARDRAFT_27688 [Jaapia argillacea MUCL 33604]|uniref:Thioesterase domain-containing protein n=1 Tax=Jaapia argillacea MUCL 33604 TaxID=933084 RepID=A0A067QAT0_9AGAM|nr:hypothetical protein JAAARDRAFT_27688 [Jaapia argillacea MUCL 33604]